MTKNLLEPLIDSSVGKYFPILESYGFTLEDNVLSIRVWDKFASFPVEWIGPIHKYKKLKNFSKLVDRVVRCHHRNGAKVLALVAYTSFPTKRSIDAKTGLWTKERDERNPVDDRFVILFEARGKLISMFLSWDKSIVSPEHHMLIDQFFELTPEEQNAIIEPDELIRLVASFNS